MSSQNSSVILAGVAALLAAPASWAALAPYSQNFEGLSGAAALSGAGFQVAGNVFDGNTAGFPPLGAFKFFYGNFPAPNGGPAFSAVATGEAGVPQGLQYLNAYSDYNCCSPGQGHLDPSAPFDYVQSSVFVEQVIAPTDIGVPTNTWRLTFDAKLPSVNGCDTAPASTCIAFIRLINPGAGNSVTYSATFDAKTLLSTTAWSTQVLTINVSDPLLSGQILQFGFLSNSRQFNNTGVYYDNIRWEQDTDGDGIADTLDNCSIVANANQRDTNGDGYGNICDPDFNGDGTVNINDFNRLKARLNIVPVVDVDTDLDGNGAVNINDFNRLKSFLGKPPGPSGLHPNCPPTCP